MALDSSEPVFFSQFEVAHKNTPVLVNKNSLSAPLPLKPASLIILSIWIEKDVVLFLILDPYWIVKDKLSSVILKQIDKKLFWERILFTIFENPSVDCIDVLKLVLMHVYFVYIFIMKEELIYFSEDDFEEPMRLANKDGSGGKSKPKCFAWKFKKKYGEEIDGLLRKADKAFLAWDF